MVPGCALAVKRLGAYLAEPLAAALQGLMVTLRTYVDDLRLEAHGRPEQAAAELRAAYDKVKERLEAIGMELQPAKCVAVASSRAHRAALRKAFEGTEVRIALRTGDLGVDTGGGAMRAVATLRKRLWKARKRATRMKRLPLPGKVRARQAKSLI